MSSRPESALPPGDGLQPEVSLVRAYQLSGVRFSYPGAAQALSGIDFAIEQGELVAILGANGSGKSTLLGLMDGLLFATQGRVEVLGQPVTEAVFLDPAFARAFRSRIGFVFQNADAQLFSATVYEEIAFGPLQLGQDDAEVRARVDDTIATLGLSRIADRAPFLLSGGEKKRVAIASVLAVGPDVLLLDEPTNGLDPRTQVWLIELLSEMNARGTTIVMATHDLGFADEMARRSIVLSEEHRVVADGPTDDILEDQETLLAVNLIHEHAHAHGAAFHAHPHAHGPTRGHGHGKDGH